MNIVHLVPHVRNTGNGLVNVAVDLACVQADRGENVTVVGEAGDYESLLGAHGVGFVPLEGRSGPASLVRNAVEVGRTIRARRADIVHVHAMAGIAYAFPWRVVGGFKVVSTVHTAFRRSSILMGFADRVIAVSDANKRALEKRGVAGRKIVVLHNAPLESPRRLAFSPSADLERPAIVSVAGLFHRKGIDVLIDAFDRIAARFPGAALYLVGAGPDEDAFRRQAAATSVASRVHFLGFQSDPQPFLRAADVFVLASREDPFPLVIAEARAAGCAIVGTRVDGIPETLDGGDAGLLVPAADAERLAEAISSLLASPELRARWAHAAGRGVDRYKVARLVDDTRAVYEEVLDAESMQATS